MKMKMAVMQRSSSYIHVLRISNVLHSTNGVVMTTNYLDSNIMTEYNREWQHKVTTRKQLQ